MPELPEVETVKNYLKPRLEKQKITDLKVINPNLRYKIPEQIKNIKNKEILAVNRRAKYINISLSNQKNIIIHLGMTGNIFCKKQKPDEEKHDHFMLKLSSGDYMLYRDVRKFGFIQYIEEKDLNKYFEKLGPEPFDESCDGKYLYQLSRNKQASIKSFIMAQENIVGVGNIYASEALFLSKISPKRKASNISLENYEKLIKNIRLVLQIAIDKGGSTIKDFKVGDEDTGYFQHEFKVYGNENKPCCNCKTLVKKIKQTGRSTFYCSKCQK